MSTAKVETPREICFTKQKASPKDTCLIIRGDTGQVQIMTPDYCENSQQAAVTDSLLTLASVVKVMSNEPLMTALKTDAIDTLERFESEIQNN